MHRPALDLSEPSRNLEESVGSPSAQTPDTDNERAMPTLSETIETVTEESNDTMPIPPPHIAARLCYPPLNQNRRKDSAASSRRNSISSVPSRSSQGISLHADAQSKYVAQHLRRASILEDRKARLADRAAHAEKVRLRAAMAKAASRNTTTSEERALAAAQARERNLAEITATCAEEVKRAKAIAESTKEKRLQEVAKMKLQMEERLAEAERRREELRKAAAARARGRERGQSLATRRTSTSDASQLSNRRPMSQEVAVSKIQWWWRALGRKWTVNAFYGLDLTIDTVMNTSFEEVAGLLAQERVLTTTARALRVCGLRDNDPDSVNQMAAVRSFLSAFLILGHPSQVLSIDKAREAQEQVGHPRRPRDVTNRLQALAGKAKDVLIAFEGLLARLGPQNNFTPPPPLRDAFVEVYDSFYHAFIAWKARDSNSLIELMVLQFAELDAIWQTVKKSTDGSVDEVYKKSIQENQVLLLVRIKKLAGPSQAKKLIFDAIRRSRKTRAKAAKGVSKPRLVDDLDESKAAGPSRPSVQSSQPSADLTQEEKKVYQQSLPAGKGLLPANRILVHELAINKEYRIEPREYREGQEHLLAPLFSSMRSTLESGDHDQHFLLLLSAAELIREKLQRLVKPGNEMHNFIAELLDIDTAKRQFSAGSFSYEKFFQAMGSLLPKLCAPIRDDEVKVLAETKLSQGNYVDRIESLIGFIDIMLSDYANYLLQMAAPQIVSSATTYEAKMFASMLQEGKIGLEAATASWRSARAQVHAEAARRDPEAINHPRSRPALNRIYNQMLVDVFTPFQPVEVKELPETLLLDYKRIVAARLMTRRIVTTGAILLQSKNLLKRDVRAIWKQEASRILMVISRADFGIEQETLLKGIVAALETGRAMPPATRLEIHALVRKFLHAASEPNPSDPVIRLLLTRLRGYILTRLAASSTSEKVRAANVAGEKLASLGLAEFADKVRELIETLSQVGMVDRDAHGAWWDEIAEKCENEASAASSAASTA